MAKLAPARRRPRKAKPGTKGLDPSQCRLDQSEGSSAEASTRCDGIKGEPPRLEDVLKTMRELVAKFNVEKIMPQDLASTAGPPDDET